MPHRNDIEFLSIEVFVKYRTLVDTVPPCPGIGHAAGGDLRGFDIELHLGEIKKITVTCADVQECAVFSESGNQSAPLSP